MTANRAPPLFHLPCSARAEEGSALVEFAASAVLLLTLLFGIMDGSRAVYIDHWVANAARDATRYGMVRGASWTTSCASTIAYGCSASATNVSAFVQTLAVAGISTGSVTTAATWPGTDATGASCTTGGLAVNSVGCVIVVKVTYSFNFVLPFLPKSTLPLSSTSKVTIEQ